MNKIYISFIIIGFFFGGIFLSCDSGRSTSQGQGKGQQANLPQKISQTETPQREKAPQGNQSSSGVPSASSANPLVQPTPSELFQRAGLSYMGNRGISAPDFSVKSLEGKSLKLSDFRGKVVFLNFWATWCPPCRAEMPSIETLYQRYKNQAVQVLAVSVQEEPSVVKVFLSQNSFTFPIALDPNGEVAQLYGIRGIPTTFIIDPKGTLQGALVGGKDWATPDVYTLLDSLMK